MDGHNETTLGVLLLSCGVILTPVLVMVGMFFKNRIEGRITTGFVPYRNATAMPHKYVEPIRRMLSQVPAGESALISFTDVEVDLKGKTFVNLSAKIRAEPNFSTVHVEVTKDGCFLTLPARDASLTFTPRKLSVFDAYLPVLEVRNSGKDGYSDPSGERG